jgi:hypothetical protein
VCLKSIHPNTPTSIQTPVGCVCLDGFEAQTKIRQISNFLKFEAQNKIPKSNFLKFEAKFLHSQKQLAMASWRHGN